MIELKDVCYRYRDFQGREHEVLKDLSFTVSKGERIVLLGINGSGKSTLLKILDALIYPQKGSYIYKGKKITKREFKKIAPLFRKEVAFLMQDPSAMLFNPTVYEEIAFGPREFGFDDVEERVYEIAEKFGIKRYLEKPPHYLSGGERQKVALAAILATEPEFLLMDEPSSNLDPPTTGWLIDLLQELEVTMVVSTHNLSLAPEFGERVVVLGEGRVVYDGDLERFLGDFELLKRARFLHKHKHAHKGITHSHYHLHDWDL